MVWIACTNPAQSLPDQRGVRAALERAELVVLQEAFADTETAAFADVLLPAATWGEKEGTVTNSERRISRVRAAVPAPGEARADWAIAVDFARRLEARLAPACLARHAVPVRDRAKRSSTSTRDDDRGRDLDISGLSYALLERDGPQQWPFPAGRASAAARGSTPTACSRRRAAARASPPTRYVPVAEARRRALSVPPHHRAGCATSGTA